MTSKQLFLKTIKDELPRFERVFEATPASKLSYRPHSRSKSALELLNVFTFDSACFSPFIKTGAIDFLKIKQQKFTKPGEIAATFKKDLLSVIKLVTRLSEKAWDKKARMLMGKKVEWETNCGDMAWGILLDLIHHRGQLSTYIRPMGGKVPSIYGPSADSK